MVVMDGWKADDGDYLRGKKKRDVGWNVPSTSIFVSEDDEADDCSLT